MIKPAESISLKEKVDELTIEKAVRMIREYLGRAGISPEELGQKTGVPTRTVYSILAGERKDPRLSTLKKLLRGCGIGVYGIPDE